jgi:hypothetical protein
MHERREDMHQHLRLVTSRPASGRPAKQIQLDARRQARIEPKRQKPVPPRAA